MGHVTKGVPVSQWDGTGWDAYSGEVGWAGPPRRLDSREGEVR